MFKLITSLLGGPAASVTAWFTSWAGKLIGILAIIGLITACGTSVYFSWEHAIKAAEAAKYEVAKRDALIDNKNKEIKILKDTGALQEAKIKDLNETVSSINLQNDAIQAWIASQKGTKGDRESSDIIKETFKRLHGSIE